MEPWAVPDKMSKKGSIFDSANPDRWRDCHRARTCQGCCCCCWLWIILAFSLCICPIVIGNLFIDDLKFDNATCKLAPFVHDPLADPCPNGARDDICNGDPNSNLCPAGGDWHDCGHKAGFCAGDKNSADGDLTCRAICKDKDCRCFSDDKIMLCPCIMYHWRWGSPWHKLLVWE